MASGLDNKKPRPPLHLLGTVQRSSRLFVNSEKEDFLSRPNALPSICQHQQELSEGAIGTIYTKHGHNVRFWYVLRRGGEGNGGGAAAVKEIRHGTFLIVKEIPCKAAAAAAATEGNKAALLPSTLTRNNTQ